MKISKNAVITNNHKLDFFLIYCPFWFPLLYLVLLSNFPSLSKIIYILAFLFFAETHFGSTWLFFFDKENTKWIKKNSYKLFVLPIYVLFLITLIWAFTPNAVLIIHYLASGFHVTRQSIGIAKISNTNSPINIFLIYLTSGLCLFLGLFNPGIFAYAIPLNLFNICIFFIIIIYFFVGFFLLTKKFNFLKNILFVFTGISIYLPLLFFENLALATVVGVGMHWCQYLGIMLSINLRKSRIQKGIHKQRSFLRTSIIFIFIYAIVMTSLTYFGMPKEKFLINSFSFLYLIPIMFQLYHFYIDGFIWKFSDIHIKNSVGKFIYRS